MQSSGGSSSESDASRSHSEWDEVSEDSGDEDTNSDGAGAETVDGFTQGRLRGMKGRANRELPSLAAMGRDCPQRRTQQASRGTSIDVQSAGATGRGYSEEYSCHPSDKGCTARQGFGACSTGTSSRRTYRGKGTAFQMATPHIQDTNGASHHIGTYERNDSGVWRRQWGAPIFEHNVHEDLRSPSTPSHASTSSGSFPTSQHMKDFREVFTNHGDWEAALEVEIENPGNLGGVESSPLPSSLRRGLQLRRRRMAAGVAHDPSLQSLSHRNNAQPSGSRKKGPKKRVAWSDADL